ncbi:hypothetical protein Lepto7375DRAFT_0230 [Leptolyngbya sp. PCC 7375]|nr:hypothetical protein Lepto7375DRAFT_0230 [Leptolyngbya sp. PCC 7375]
MHVTHRTTKILRLQANRDFRCNLILFIVGASILVAGIVISVALTLMSQLVVLECNRIGLNQIDCKLTSSSLLRSKVTEIRQLQGVELVGMSGNKDNVDTDLKLMLISGSGRIETYFDEYYSRLNAFINDSSQMIFKIQYDDRWAAFLGWLITLPLTLPGGLLIWSMLLPQKKIVTLCIFDKDSGQVILKLQHILLSKSDIRKENLDDIEKLKIDEFNINNWRFYHTKLVFKMDKSIILLESRQKSAHTTLTQAISQFLGSSVDSSMVS